MTCRSLDMIGFKLILPGSASNCVVFDHHCCKTGLTHDPHKTLLFSITFTCRISSAVGHAFQSAGGDTMRA